MADNSENSLTTEAETGSLPLARRSHQTCSSPPPLPHRGAHRCPWKASKKHEGNVQSHRIWCAPTYLNRSSPARSSLWHVNRPVLTNGAQPNRDKPFRKTTTPPFKIVNREFILRFMSASPSCQWCWESEGGREGVRGREGRRRYANTSWTTLRQQPRKYQLLGRC